MSVEDVARNKPKPILPLYFLALAGIIGCLIAREWLWAVGCVVLLICCYGIDMARGYAWGKAMGEAVLKEQAHENFDRH